MRSLCSLSSSIAARLTWPSFSMSARTSSSVCSQAMTVASAASLANTSVELEMRRRELLRMDSRRTRVSCAASLACLHRGARALHTLLGVEALLIESAQVRIRILEAAPRARELGLHFEPTRERVIEPRLQLDDRRIAVRELLLQLLAALARAARAARPCAAGLLTELSVERRDSIRISRSRRRPARPGRARAVPAAPRAALRVRSRDRACGNRADPA